MNWQVKFNWFTEKRHVDNEVIFLLHSASRFNPIYSVIIPVLYCYLYRGVRTPVVVNLWPDRKMKQWRKIYHILINMTTALHLTRHLFMNGRLCVVIVAWPSKQISPSRLEDFGLQDWHWALDDIDDDCSSIHFWWPHMVTLCAVCAVQCLPCEKIRLLLY